MMAMTVLSPPIPPTATAITALAAATDRLLATIDAMPAGAFRAGAARTSSPTSR